MKAVRRGNRRRPSMRTVSSVKFRAIVAKIKGWEEGQQWYSGTLAPLWKDKPCRFNAIRRFTGSRRAFRPVQTNRVLAAQKSAGLEKRCFVAVGASVRMKSLVLRLRKAGNPGLHQTERENQMALKCEICGKAPHYGNVISHANNTRRRRWNPNLRRMRAVVAGVKKHIRVCTACIRAGRVKKAA